MMSNPLPPGQTLAYLQATTRFIAESQQPDAELRRLLREQYGIDARRLSRFTLLALRDQIAPPTINLDQPGEGCDLDYIPHKARAMKIDTALSNSFGFGGTNACILLRRYQP